ncbi:putative DNA binding domain-containing protein [Mycoplasma mycoides subsp. capri]|uniref:RNA-binding domain-containing protein n=1 Tax=Mycoplasma mycoides TaxID=2102 RepID=UPI0022403B30|nr:RNA-binding domain-containing protein [Mycoplasma mycoides]QVJ96627.1 putative DNA binding domain-containing protein [Mycoplasma mycoides subsp. capri]QVJ97517.1 putative DNA binding domain-containing protein [Mycoplasma mycoides subsp. capri]QVK00509.1 putative DNA binding domain-containing protein [Mycoplasma mycoides subsp. capri]QVK01396.1 putative DNA binding domain-containing protein [Mycoplasma mycoides subsp. capri]
MFKIPIESSTHENKELFDENKPKNILKTICAFANTNNGSIYIGVNDNGQIIGIDNVKNKINKLSSFIKDKINPIPKFSIKSEVINKKTIIIIEVEKGDNTPYYLFDQGTLTAYVRYGDQTHIASREEIFSLGLSGKNLSYDALQTDIPWNSATFNLLNSYFKELGIRIIEDYNDLVSLELAKNNVLTNAGALLADQKFIKHSLVFATYWNDFEKSNKTGGKSIENFDGSLLEILKNSQQFVENKSNVDFKKTDTKRIDYPDYPKLAIREALVNALVHRDYTKFYDQININMYTDRLEIISPGGMVDKSKIQELDPYRIESKRRNPILANIFSMLKLMERRGSGIKEILNIYAIQENYSLKHIPQFISDDKSFIVILKNLNYEQAESLNINTNEYLDKVNTKIHSDIRQDIIQDTNTDENKFRSTTTEQIEIVLEFAKKHTKFKRIDIDKLLNVSPTRSRAILTQLIEENKLITIGSFKDKEYLLA